MKPVKQDSEKMFIRLKNCISLSEMTLNSLCLK